ncbi:N-6 DNA methylase [Desulfovibrio sp. ZJ200]|uniref:tRNA1(Val) (adenine(37)-N6)-methyltransferase n=1 Tax=Desulfovibrio sp. ZJ200 TaxID=2709792 RepID=UPI001F14CBAA|nr:N-6 DNA methylase [Desulfovibrio sp. ZJ200]
MIRHISEINAARARFPRGLAQPVGALRFGLDALLLAAFAAGQCQSRVKNGGNAPAPGLCGAELGCGCGAALLGLALRCPELTGLGLEREAELLRAARQNVAALGCQERLRFARVDIADRAALRQSVAVEGFRAGALDLVLANPPYGLPGRGRASPSSLRERALRGPAALTDFCRAAAELLRHHGRFFCIFDARQLPRLCAELDRARLGLRRILPVRARSSAPALRILVEARKNAAPDLRLESPLTLHGAKARRATKTGAQAAIWSAQALRFCPWLAAGVTTDS